MRTWLNGRLVELVREFVSLEMKSRGPQLCCEAKSTDPAALVNSVVSQIKAWKKAHVLCLAREGGTVRGRIIDLADVSAVVARAVDSEDVVSFIDITELGGCAVDFSPLPQGAVEVLLTAWGSRESTAENLAITWETKVFRGN